MVARVQEEPILLQNQPWICSPNEPSHQQVSVRMSNAMFSLPVSNVQNVQQCSENQKGLWLCGHNRSWSRKRILVGYGPRASLLKNLIFLNNRKIISLSPHVYGTLSFLILVVNVKSKTYILCCTIFIKDIPNIDIAQFVHLCMVLLSRTNCDQS